MSRLQNTIIDSVRTAIKWVPAGWLPGSTPDPLIARRAAIGRQTSRIDGPAKVTGQASFAAEVEVQRLSFMALVHSPLTRGQITGIAVHAAETAPGVICVVTHLNMPRIGTPPLIGVTNIGAVGNSSLPILQDAVIRYNGQIVAAVVAETQEQADHAASLIVLDYSSEPAKTVFEDAKGSARTPASIIMDRNHVTVGKPEHELATAAWAVDNLYRTPSQNHNAIELHTVTAIWRDGQLDVHDTTQMISGTAGALAKLFGLKKEQVRVRSPLVGGGFGGKGLWDHQILAAAVARMIDRPVRLTLSREGVYRIIGGRAASEQRAAVAADESGKFTAVIHTGFSVMPPYSACPEQYTLGTRALYQSRSFEFVQRHLDLDIVPNSFMRAPGEAIGTFAVESAIDELAHKMGIDPVELRLRNIAEHHPISGVPFSQHALHEAFSAGAKAFGWDQRQELPKQVRQGEWQIGLGCASGTYPYMRMPGANVRITLRDDGSALVACSAQEMGMGTATVQAQHAADRLGLPLEAVTIELGDSDLPSSPLAGSSAQTVSIAGAIAAGADKLLTELLRLAGNASPLSGLRASEVRLADGALVCVHDPSRRENYRSILARAGRDGLTVTAAGSPPLEMLKFTMHSTSAVFCGVRVSEITGEVRVARLLGSFDCGTILNPKTAASQFRGGMIMGLGLALMEETLFDERSGRIMNASLADYHIPSHLDVPRIDVMWTGIPDPRSPLGARGIGEIGVTGVAAAVANAVFNATGTRIRDLPITPDKLFPS